MQLRRLMLGRLAESAREAIEVFDHPTGRFLAPGGGWAVTNQDAILALALLYVTESTENPCHGDARMLELACRGGDALRDAQDDEGRVEFVKPDGSRWGKLYMPWSMYHWLETFRLLRPHLDDPRRARWENGLRLAYAGIARQIQTAQRAHNISTWNAMGLVRAGQTFDMPDWVRAGSAHILAAAHQQDPDGYWSEGGPSTAYNMVYVHALGLYYDFTRDASILPALERALDFHLHFTYPDGRPVETIDGRVSYRDVVPLMGLPGFLPFPRGRRYSRFLLECSRQAKSILNYLPHLAAAALCSPGAVDEAPIPQEAEFATNFRGRAIVRQAGPWFLCLSGYLHSENSLAESFRARFRLDRQNYLSIWHRSVGLIIGGGNSKFHPQCSTFSMLQGRERWVQAEAADLSAGGDADSALYRYGRVACELRVRILDPSAIEISMRAGGGDCQAMRGGFTMPLRPGQRLVSSLEAAPLTLDLRQSYVQDWASENSGSERWIMGEGWRLDLPPGSAFEWPHYRYNPYVPNYGGSDDMAVAAVSVPLTPGDPWRTFILRIRE